MTSSNNIIKGYKIIIATLCTSKSGLWIFKVILVILPKKIECQFISSNNISKEYKTLTVSLYRCKHGPESFKVDVWYLLQAKSVELNYENTADLLI